MSAQGIQIHTTHFVSSVHFVKLAFFYVKTPETVQRGLSEDMSESRLAIKKEVFKPLKW